MADTGLAPVIEPTKETRLAVVLYGGLSNIGDVEATASAMSSITLALAGILALHVIGLLNSIPDILMSMQRFIGTLLEGL